MARLASMGFLLFSIGNGLAITGLVLAALGYAQGSAGAWIIALVAVGQLTTLGSVLVLGNDGYQALQARGSSGAPGSSRSDFASSKTTDATQLARRMPGY